MLGDGLGDFWRFGRVGIHQNDFEGRVFENAIKLAAAAKLNRQQSGMQQNRNAKGYAQNAQIAYVEI